ncbi:hypothetical protein [Brevundimonas sp.]|uniref:hypothetical protein n=1 Tax=Brevundimonas sp. TaxID=1871086 RepID=UPI003D6D5FE4
MTLFGYTIDGGQLFGLISLLSVLALWLIVLGRERHYGRWFRQWEADRKARRDAENGQSSSPGSGHAKRGPWG